MVETIIFQDAVCHSSKKLPYHHIHNADTYMWIAHIAEKGGYAYHRFPLILYS